MSDLIPGPPQQDYIVLAGTPSPGKAVVRGASSPRKWDIQAGYGLTGATVIFNGEGLAQFDVDFYAWEPEHFVLWEVFAKLTLENPPIGARPTSMSIQHPALNSPPLKITQVVVTNVTQWDLSDETGEYMRTVSFLQYRKAKPALVKPLEGPPGSPVAVEPPIDPQEMLIRDQNAEIKRLSDEGARIDAANRAASGK